MNRQKRFRERFRFHEDICKKRVTVNSQRLRGHGNDYADTIGKLRRLITDFKGTIR